MKFKTIMLGLMIGAVIISQMACSNKWEDKQNSAIETGTDTVDGGIAEVTDFPEATTAVSNQDNIEDIDDSGIREDFNTLIASKDVKATDVITFIKSNVEKVTSENASVMLLALEEIQNKNITALEEKYFPETMQVRFQKAYQEGIDLKQIDQITDTVLRDLLQETVDNGYKMEQAEGMYYPVIDYSVYKQFEVYVTPDSKDYIWIMAQESDQVFAKDAALIISWEEVIKRALSMEAFLNTYRESVKADAIRALYLKYESATLYGLNNTPLFDYDTKVMKEEAKSAYEKSISGEWNSDYLTELKGYMEVIKANNYKLTDEVEKYRKNITSN